MITRTARDGVLFAVLEQATVDKRGLERQDIEALIVHTPGLGIRIFYLRHVVYTRHVRSAHWERGMEHRVRLTPVIEAFITGLVIQELMAQDLFAEGIQQAADYEAEFGPVAALLGESV